jgi:hypothetical protein
MDGPCLSLSPLFSSYLILLAVYLSSYLDARGFFHWYNIFPCLSSVPLGFIALELQCIF